MAEKEKTYLPQSTAGLMRYMDVEERIQIRPSHVIAISLVFAGAIMILKLFA